MFLGLTGHPSLLPGVVSANNRPFVPGTSRPVLALAVLSGRAAHTCAQVFA